MPILLTEQAAPSLAELVEIIGAQAPGLVVRLIDGSDFDSNHRVRGVGSLGSASASEISFIVSPKYAQQLDSTQACAVAMDETLFQARQEQHAAIPHAVVVSTQPYLFYALLASWFDQARRARVEPGVHPSAVVAPDATIDPSAVVGPHVVIGARTSIGAGARVHANSVIGDDCVIGAQSVIYPNVTFYDHVRVGERAVLHSGVVLGADGFGFAPNPMAGKGAWGKIAQLGGVRIGNDVEIGANTTIDRGALEDTVIGHGVKLDNQIMIAHNCEIGDHTAMAACVGIAGSTRIGQRCIIGGAAMFAGHLTVTDDVQISGGTAVTSDITQPGRYTGVFPLASHADWQKNAAVLGQLSNLRRRLREIERK